MSGINPVTTRPSCGEIGTNELPTTSLTAFAEATKKVVSFEVASSVRRLISLRSLIEILMNTMWVELG